MAPIQTIIEFCYDKNLRVFTAGGTCHGALVDFLDTIGANNT